MYYLRIEVGVGCLLLFGVFSWDEQERVLGLIGMECKTRLLCLDTSSTIYQINLSYLCA